MKAHFCWMQNSDECVDDCQVNSFQVKLISRCFFAASAASTCPGVSLSSSFSSANLPSGTSQKSSLGSAWDMEIHLTNLLCAMRGGVGNDKVNSNAF